MRFSLILCVHGYKWASAYLVHEPEGEPDIAHTVAVLTLKFIGVIDLRTTRRKPMSCHHALNKRGFPRYLGVISRK